MSTWCALPDSDISISTAAARSCGFPRIRFIQDHFRIGCENRQGVTYDRRRCLGFCRGYACDVALDRLIISPEFFHIHAHHFISNTDLIEKLLPPRRPGSQVDLPVRIGHEWLLARSVTDQSFSS